ncbi:hypothetical protein C0W59_22290 [Photobacterium kishitanii]|nr:hypothetical protein C0W59_22290 [Photobacterium kishitanii]
MGFFVFIFILSNSSFAKNISSNISILEPDFKMSPTKRYDNGIYYIQFMYTKKSKESALSKTLEVQKELELPMAIQYYNNGYRLYVGVVEGKYIRQTQQLLNNMGYKNTLIKKINIPVKMAVEREFSFKKIGRIKKKSIIIPYNKEGTPFRLLSFEIHSICQSINAEASIASLNDYKDILSDYNTVSYIGIQYRFWLTSGRSITRISDKLVISNADNQSKYPIICII